MTFTCKSQCAVSVAFFDALASQAVQQRRNLKVLKGGLSRKPPRRALKLTTTFSIDH